MPGDKGEDRKTNQIVVYDPLNKRLWCEDRDEFVKGTFETWISEPFIGVVVDPELMFVELVLTGT